MEEMSSAGNVFPLQTAENGLFHPYDCPPSYADVVRQSGIYPSRYPNAEATFAHDVEQFSHHETEIGGVTPSSPPQFH
jgi:hypothetical protein